MLEFCEGLTVPICIFTPFGHKDDSGLEYMLVECIFIDADIFRTTAVEMQVLQQRTGTESFTAYDVERSREIDSLQPIAIGERLFLNAHEVCGKVHLLKMMAVTESLDDFYQSARHTPPLGSRLDEFLNLLPLR